MVLEDAAEFDKRQCGGTPTTHDTIEKFVKKFKETGSVEDKQRSGRPRTSTDEETSTNALKEGNHIEHMM